MQWNDQRTRHRTVRGRLPIVATVNARTCGDDVTDFCINDVLPVGNAAGCFIDGREDVLVDHFGSVDERAGLPVKLPENTVFADGEESLLIVDINQNPLEANLHVDGLAGDMLKVPGDLAGLRVQGQGRVGVEGRIQRRHSAAGGDPGLCLGSPYIKEFELRVVAAGDPGVAAGP